jgi:hypothetical protein
MVMNKTFPDIEQLRELPPQLASGLDRLIEKQRRLSWAAPVCGLMNP